VDHLTQVVLMFSLLFLKHFVFDFLLQVAYHYKNKGKYGHPGGLCHAGAHTIASFLLLSPFFGASALLYVLCVGEGLAHYHLDWAKMKINTTFGWSSTNSEKFWWMVGLDQFAHYMTYAAMTFVYFRYFSYFA